MTRPKLLDLFCGEGGCSVGYQRAGVRVRGDGVTTIGSLFSGYGGLESATRNVFGGNVAWVSDIDPGACKILAHHWPDVPNLGDITTVDWSQVEPVDILTGGSPCQDLSHAGKRGGMKTGTRSNLWVAMREAIAQLRPSWVVWENVRGAYSAEADSDVELCPGCVGDGPSVHLRALGRVLGDLASIGYDAAWHGLTAASIGAPHGRYRVFLLAWPQSGDPDVCDSDGWATAGFSREEGSQAGPAADTGRDEPERRRGLRDVGGAAPADEGAGGQRQRVRDATVDSGSATPDTDRVGHERGGDARGRRGGPADSGHDVAHADGEGLAQREGIPGDARPERAATERGGGVAAHPESNARRVGNRDNGTAGGVDGYAGHSNAGQGVSDLRSDVQPQTIRWSTGEHSTVPTPGVLLTGMREQSSGRGQGHAPLAGTETQGAVVHQVRHDRKPPCASHRPEPREQRPGQLADSLRVMSSHVALVGGPGEAVGECGKGSGYGCSAWGQFAQAIHRWEICLGRVAPSPTELAPKGGRRLSAHAVEFMQGLPAGHVTDVPGLTRNEQLKALGNGVVPQQAERALRGLLHSVAVAA